MHRKFAPVALALAVSLAAVLRANAQCTLTQTGDLGSVFGIDEAWTSVWGYCEGPDCVYGKFIVAQPPEALRNPCPDEPALIQIDRLAIDTQGVKLLYSIQGLRSGALYRAGWYQTFCWWDGLEGQDQPFAPCVQCDGTRNDIFVQSGGGWFERYAHAAAENLCTASCQRVDPRVSIRVYDDCAYNFWEPHTVTAQALTLGGGVATAGAEAEAEAYYWGQSFCRGEEISRCNGYYQGVFLICRCPNE